MDRPHIDPGSFVAGAIVSAIGTFMTTEAWAEGEIKAAWAYAVMFFLLTLGCAFSDHLLPSDDD